MRVARNTLIVATLFAAAACAGLGLEQIIQPPRFTEASGRQAEIRLAGPSVDRPMGGATVRLWARVDNPNTFGLTLAALNGSLFLEGTRAANVEFPLGLPLPAAGDTIIPLDIAISFADLPGLAGVATRALSGSPLAYRLDGSFAVDAGLGGRPSFGPMTLLQGSARPVR